MNGLTVAICTRNRADSLAVALERLCALAIPDGVWWEVVVIDNGSTDHTKEVIESFAGRLPISRHFEPKPGLSNGRNHALEVAKGDFVLSVDDDVLVRPGWLAAYAEGVRKYPDADVFGGPVRPVFEGTPPKWLTAGIGSFSSVFCMVDLGPEEIHLSNHDIPLGSNYAVRRDVGRRIGYDPKLGVGSDVAPLGEESVMIRSILSDGGYGIWLPTAAVDHFIPAERQSLAHIGKYFVAYGMTLTYLSAQSKTSSDFTRTLFGAPRWALRVAAQAWIAYAALRLIGDAGRWAKWFVAFNTVRGRIKMTRRLAADAFGDRIDQRGNRNVAQPGGSTRPGDALERLTVAVCTRNRADSLADALEHLCALAIPEGVWWEVVVVDNGSTDHTKEVLARFANRLPLRSDQESKPGVSNARNRALSVAQGDFVLWIDDDVMVDPHWLEAHLRGMRGYPDAVTFGGPVRPRLEGTPPDWLLRGMDEFASVYCAIDLGPHEVRFDPSGQQIPFGSNYSIRRDAALRIGYDPNLGPGSPIAPLGDETVLIRKMLSDGAYGMWLPDALVDHVIPAGRQTLAYLGRYFSAYGMTLGYLGAKSGAAPPPTIFGVPRWVLRALVQAWVAYRLARFSGDARRWAKPFVAFHIHRGRLKYARLMARRGPPAPK